MHDALAVSGELANPFWFYPRVKVIRQTARHAQPSPTQPALFRSADDRYLYFALILADQKPWTGARGVDGQRRSRRRPGRPRVLRPRAPAAELRPRPGDGRGLLHAPRRRAPLPRGPAPRPADRRHQRSRGPLRTTSTWPRASSSCRSSSRTGRPHCSRAARTGSAPSTPPGPVRAPRLGRAHRRGSRRAAGPWLTTSSHGTAARSSGIGATEFSKNSRAHRGDPGHRGVAAPRWRTPASPLPTSTGSSRATWTSSATTPSRSRSGSPT